MVLRSAFMRLAIYSFVGILTQVRSASAEGADAARTWSVGAIGLQATEWRIETRGIDQGATALFHAAGVAATDWSSTYGTSTMSLGGGEGGVQAEYIQRFAYGLRFWRFGQGALVLRGGLVVDAIGKTHFGTVDLGPLVELGYQTVTTSGFVDVGMQTVIPVIPAVLFENSSRHAAEWFNSGPHVGAGFRPVYFDGYAPRTMYDGHLRTEFHLDLCGAAELMFCVRLHDFRYDDAHKPVTFLGLLVGFGGTGPGKRKNAPSSIEHH